MPPRMYVREDRRIRVTLEGDQFQIEEVTGSEPPTVRRWTYSIGGDDVHRLVGEQDPTALTELVNTSFIGPGATLSRLVLEVPSSLAWADWEVLVEPIAEGRTVVRSVANRPSYAGHPMLLPLRLLHFTYGRPSVELWIDGVVGPGRRAPGVLTATTSEPQGPAVLRRLGWPVADVIHVTVPYRGGALETSFAELERLVRVAQCRLLVLEPTDPDDRPSMLSTAARIAARGGPSVVVPAADDPGFAAFYADVVHDKPLDLAVAGLSRACLYADHGREDGLRVSTAGTELHLQLRYRDQPTLPATTSAAVRSFIEQWNGFDFAHRESDGLYPLAEAVHLLRAASQPSAPRTDPVARYVVPALCRDGREIPTAPRRPLDRDALYELCVEVGSRSEETAVARAQPLLFERQLWDEADDGVWLDVGVTGIGWDVIGEAEQPLFVPKSGPSEPCRFAVRPREPGVPALRFTLFHEGHVIQSFRLAAVVAQRDGESPSATDSALADVLMLGTDEVRERTWRARLEFSTVATIEQSRQRPPRALAIVANELSGQPVLTFKGAGEFHVHTPGGDVEEWVRRGRALLEDLTFSRTTGNYRMGLPGGDPNAGTTDMFTTDFRRLAEYGADLYDYLVPLETRRALPPLGGPTATIQVAGILRDKVIPWALVYQGKYDAGTVEDEDGEVADHAVCTALLDDADPAAFTRDCGQASTCLLHAGNVAARAGRGEPPLLPDTVACPGRLWGFRHRLELPPAQVPPDGVGTAAVEEIDVSPHTAAVLAVSRDLTAARLHSNEVRDLAREQRGWTVYEPTRKAQLLSALGRDDLAVVHVLSHANGGPDGPLPPELQFYDERRGRVAVKPSLLRDVTWSRHPIVVLNGCGTAGFSAKAVSQFIRAFVDERHAAAVLGTEASVAEFLAAEFGHLFLTAFLRGGSAGDALLAARRALLTRYNPLGLSYTLYGMSELRLSGSAMN